MPASKPATLNRRHDAKSASAKRIAAESAVTPQTGLRVAPPPALKGHRDASATWKRLIALYAEVDGAIATAFDEDLLTKYCLISEECDWLSKIRTEIERQYNIANKRLEKAKPKSDEMQAYYNALAQVNTLLARLQGFDARLDGKRKLLHTLEQSLYLTPRSRAGVAPPTKEPPPPKEGMESLLDE